MKKTQKTKYLITALCCLGLALGAGCSPNKDSSLEETSSSVNDTSIVETKAVVTFDANGGSAVDAQEVEKGSAATEPTTTRDGYTFDGWYLGEQKFDFATQTISEDITLKAMWTAKTDIMYKIEVYAENEAGEYVKLSEEDLGTEIKLVRWGTTDSSIDLAEEVQTYLGGMMGIALNEELSVLQGTINGDASSVFKVYFDRCAYTISFLDENGMPINGAESLTVKYGTTVLLSSFPEIPAATEPGKVGVWKFGDDILGEQFIWTYTQNQEVQIAYIDTPRNITFKIDGENYEVKQVEKGDKVTAPEITPNKTGYSFVCWKDESGNAFDFDTAILTDIVLTAYYQANTYTLKLDLDTTQNGTEDEIQVAYGAKVLDSLATISKPGYYAESWSINGTVVTEDTAWDWTEEQIAIATWCAMAYNVVFMVDDEQVDAQSVQYGQTLNAPSMPGYDVSWKLNGETFDFTTLIAEDIVLTASSATDITLKKIVLKDGAKVTVGGVEVPVEYDADGNYGLASVYNSMADSCVRAEWNYNVTTEDIAVWKSLGYTHVTFSVYAGTNNGYGDSLTELDMFGGMDIATKLNISFNAWVEAAMTLEDFEAYITNAPFYFLQWSWVGYTAQVLVSEMTLTSYNSVTFVLDNAEQKVKVKSGTAVAAPFIAGYDIAWKLNGETFDFNTPITEDITLTASTATDATLKQIRFTSDSWMTIGDDVLRPLQNDGDKWGLLEYTPYGQWQSFQTHCKFDLTVDDIDAWIAAGYTHMTYTVTYSTNGDPFTMFDGNTFTGQGTSETVMPLSALRTYIENGTTNFVNCPWATAGQFYIEDMTVINLSDITPKEVKFTSGSWMTLGDDQFRPLENDGNKYGLINYTAYGQWQSFQTYWLFDLTVADIDLYIAAGYTHMTYSITYNTNANPFVLFDGTQLSGAGTVEKSMTLEELKAYIANGTTNFVTCDWATAGQFYVEGMTIVKN